MPKASGKNTVAVDGLSLIFPQSLCWHNFSYFLMINFCVVLTYFKKTTTTLFQVYDTKNAETSPLYE